MDRGESSLCIASRVNYRHLGGILERVKTMNGRATKRTLGLSAVLLAGAAALAAAQQPAAAANAPDVGQQAPDFTLPGATRFGLLKVPVHLADFRGQTVVLAFFPKARTKG